MILSKLILAFGVVAAIGMIAWGVSGIVLGKVMTKSYGSTDGKRHYYRFVRRDEEPVWFWTLCGIYSGVGVAMLIMIRLLLRTPAFSA